MSPCGNRDLNQFTQVRRFYSLTDPYGFHGLASYLIYSYFFTSPEHQFQGCLSFFPLKDISREQICFPSNKYIRLYQAAVVFPPCWCLREMAVLSPSLTPVAPILPPAWRSLGPSPDAAGSGSHRRTGGEEGWVSSPSPAACCVSRAGETLRSPLQFGTLTLSFPSVPSHVRRGGHHLVPGVRPPRDHHHELRLLAVHGLDRLCPLPLRRLRHRVLLGRRADLRREPLLLRLGIQLAHPRQERSRVDAPGTPHGCRRMLWLVGPCALGLLLLTRAAVSLPGGDLEKQHKCLVV